MALAPTCAPRFFRKNTLRGNEDCQVQRLINSECLDTMTRQYTMISSPAATWYVIMHVVAHVFCLCPPRIPTSLQQQHHQSEREQARNQAHTWHVISSRTSNFGGVKVPTSQQQLNHQSQCKCARAPALAWHVFVHWPPDGLLSVKARSVEITKATIPSVSTWMRKNSGTYPTCDRPLGGRWIAVSELSKH